MEFFVVLFPEGTAGTHYITGRTEIIVVYAKYLCSLKRVIIIINTVGITSAVVGGGTLHTVHVFDLLQNIICYGRHASRCLFVIRHLDFFICTVKLYIYGIVSSADQVLFDLLIRSLNGRNNGNNGCNTDNNTEHRQHRTQFMRPYTLKCQSYIF